jgi:hypothetical protein
MPSRSVTASSAIRPRYRRPGTRCQALRRKRPPPRRGHALDRRRSTHVEPGSMWIVARPATSGTETIQRLAQQRGRRHRSMAWGSGATSPVEPDMARVAWAPSQVVSLRTHLSLRAQTTPLQVPRSSSRHASRTSPRSSPPATGLRRSCRASGKPTPVSAGTTRPSGIRMRPSTRRSWGRAPSRRVRPHEVRTRCRTRCQALRQNEVPSPGIQRVINRQRVLGHRPERGNRRG